MTEELSPSHGLNCEGEAKLCILRQAGDDEKHLSLPGPNRINWQGGSQHGRSSY